MIESKDIADYFDTTLSSIKPLVRLDFDIHLYFAQNQHMVVLFKKGEIPSAEIIQKYRSKGLNKIWIHKNNFETFKTYSASRTKEGALLSTLINSSELGGELKKAAGKEIAKVLLQNATQAKTFQEQQEINKKNFQTIRDILDQTALQAESCISEILKLCDVDPVLTHGINVATYAVVFAMAFGKIAPDLLADIALAGLLHDIGVSQIPISILQTPWQAMDREIFREYAEHVHFSLKLINEFSVSTSERVKLLIDQHHEKFNGSGYPNGYKAFQFNDIAQLLTMADLVDSISNGRWDGKKRTLKDALDVINKLESVTPTPEYFNPEILKAVFYWISHTETSEPLTQVVDTVSSQAKHIKQLS